MRGFLEEGKRGGGGEGRNRVGIRAEDERFGGVGRGGEGSWGFGKWDLGDGKEGGGWGYLCLWLQRQNKTDWVWRYRGRALGCEGGGVFFCEEGGGGDGILKWLRGKGMVGDIGGGIGIIYTYHGSGFFVFLGGGEEKRREEIRKGR